MINQITGSHDTSALPSFHFSDHQEIDASSFTEEIAKIFQDILIDVFTLYLKTKNFLWHLSGAEFTHHRNILNGHTEQLFAMVDPIADRLRKLGKTSTNAIAHIAELQRTLDENYSLTQPEEMLAELHQDNSVLSARLHGALRLCDQQLDFGAAHLLSTWITQTRDRSWFLLQLIRPASKLN